MRVVADLLTYRAAPGVADTLIVTSTASSGGTFDVVVGTANRMRAGAGCTRAGTFQVRCAGVVSASILLGDGNDTLGADSGALPRVVRGGSGNDRLFGGSGHDVLRGGAGNDQADAGVGDESILRGGSGDDLLGGSGGADILIGGAGRDILIGRAGPDKVLGGSGNDTLEGFHAGNLGGAPTGPDEDTLEGVPGATGSRAAPRATAS